MRRDSSDRWLRMLLVAVALLLPIGQCGAGLHALSHACGQGRAGSVAADSVPDRQSPADKSVHNPCELCAAYAALDGSGALPAGPMALLVAAASPLSRSVPAARDAASLPPYLSQAPPAASA